MYNCTCCNHTFNHRTENCLKAELATNMKVFMGTPACTDKYNWLVCMYLEDSQSLATQSVGTWTLHSSTAQQSSTNPLAQAQLPVFPVSEQSSFSSVLEPPTTPQGAADKHYTHFSSVAEEGPGTRMWFFFMGEGYELLLDSEKFLTALFYLGKLFNLSCVSVFLPVKLVYLLERSTHLSSTSEIKISA